MLSGPDPKPVLSGNSRTYRVWMDTNQYQRDMARVVKGEEVCECSSMYNLCNVELMYTHIIIYNM